MKRPAVLFVTPDFPNPPVDAPTLQADMLLRRLAPRYDVTVLALCGRPGGSAHELEYGRLGIRVELFPPPVPRRLGEKIAQALCGAWPYPADRLSRSELRAAVARHASSGAYQLLHLYTAYLMPLASLVRDVPVLLHLPDALSLNYAELAAAAPAWTSRLIWRWEASRAARMERRFLPLASATLTVSDRDLRHLEALAPGTSVDLVPLAVDADYFRVPEAPPDPRRLVYHGSLWYPPNVDALTHFLLDIFPEVRLRRPDVSLVVAGRRPSQQLEAFVRAQPGVEFLGEVEDIRPVLARGAIHVNPLRAGSGMQNKVLEAMASARAVVATPEAVRGLERARPGEELLVAAGPRAFADAVISLLDQPARAIRLGHAARRRVERDHSPERVAQLVEEIYARTLRVSSRC